MPSRAGGRPEAVCYESSAVLQLLALGAQAPTVPSGDEKKGKPSC